LGSVPTGATAGSKVRPASDALAPFAMSCVTITINGFFVPGSSRACGSAATSPPAARSPAGFPSFMSKAGSVAVWPDTTMVEPALTGPQAGRSASGRIQC
jgi:hypothetical protein